MLVFWVLVGSHRKLCKELIGGVLALAGSTNKCRASSLASNIETLDAVIEPYLMTLKFLMKQVTGNKFIPSLLCM
jgi:outer membrane murein-binding lipoprotein Lpp